MKSNQLAIEKQTEKKNGNFYLVISTQRFSTLARKFFFFRFKSSHPLEKVLYDYPFTFLGSVTVFSNQPHESNFLSWVSFLGRKLQKGFLEFSGEILVMSGEDMIKAEGICDVEDTVFVAVGKNVKEGKSVLSWALKSFAGRRICVLHVHQPNHLFSSSKLTPTCFFWTNEF